MEEQLINFKTAKLAKEKGFNRQCFYYYDKTEKLIEPYEENGSSTDVEFRVNLTDLLDNYNEGYRENYSASTQSLLQKWLRETHQLHLEIQVQDYVETPKFYWNIFGAYKNNKMIICIANSPREDYVSYEEALEAGLQKALSCI